MNILRKITIQNLKLNKKRSVVTTIGILLSVALITAVATMVTSFRESMIEYEKNQVVIMNMFFMMYLIVKYLF